jgi:hypothetical protein
MGGVSGEGWSVECHAIGLADLQTHVAGATVRNFYLTLKNILNRHLSIFLKELCMPRHHLPAPDIRWLKRMIGADEMLLKTSGVRPGRTRAELSQLKTEIAFRRFELAAVRHGIALRKYNLNQPRVPAGTHEGGQWTDNGNGQWAGNGNASSASTPVEREFEPKLETDATGMQPWKTVATAYDDDGAIAQQAVTMRDGSYVRSTFADAEETMPWDERHTVVLPGGGAVMFETAGNVQTIKDKNGQTLGASAWTRLGAEPQAFVQPAFAPPAGDPRVAAVLFAATTLYTWMSSQNTADEKAVFAFNASAFVPGANSSAPAVWVGKLSREEVDAACLRHYEVQSIADQSAAMIDPERYESAANYGTAVHTLIRDEINGPPTTPASPPRDPNFRAEVSVFKSGPVRYGKLGSIRVDVFENPGTGTVCVYDIKTGKEGLSPLRALEIASNVHSFYPGTQKIIVTETRPKR